MTGATRQVEIMVRTIMQPGTLGRLIASTVSCGASVLASWSFYDSSTAVVKLVTQDAHRITRALRAGGFACQSRPVVLVEMPDKPDLLDTLRSKLAAMKIEVLDSYSFRIKDERAYAVFRTTDDNLAVYVLELNAMVHHLAAAKSWRRPAGPEDEELYVEKYAA